MKTYENDDAMVDELYKIMEYIQMKHRTNDEAMEASYSLEDTIIEIREAIEV